MKLYISFTNDQHNTKLLIMVVKQHKGKGIEVCITCEHIDNRVTYQINMCNLASVKQHMRIQVPGAGLGNYHTFSPQIDWIPLSTHVCTK